MMSSMLWRGVPVISATTLGSFRIAFGLALLTSCLGGGVLFAGPVPEVFETGYPPLARAAVVQRYASSGARF